MRTNGRHVSLTVTNRTRSGSMIVFAMIALMFASVVCAAILRTVVLNLRQIRLEEQRVQTVLLAGIPASLVITWFRQTRGLS